MKIRGLVCCWLVTLCCANRVLAQDQALLVTVRELAKESLQDFDEGRYEQAAEKSLKAYQVARVPTLALNRARALVKLGKLIAASELYLEATRLERSESWQAIQEEAQAAAERERLSLLERIPRLRIALENADESQVSVAIDGTPVPVALLGSEQMVDPGPHKVVGKYGHEILERSVSIAENERLSTQIRFTSKPIAKALSIASSAPKAEPRPTTSVSARRPDSKRRIVGYSSLGLGGIGIAFGAIEGFAASAKREEMLDTGQCASDRQHCAPSLSGEIDSYRTMRTLSTVGFAAGGFLTLTGMALLLWSTDHESPRAVGLVTGPNYLGVWGTVQ